MIGDARFLHTLFRRNDEVLSERYRLPPRHLFGDPTIFVRAAVHAISSHAPKRESKPCVRNNNAPFIVEISQQIPAFAGKMERGRGFVISSCLVMLHRWIRERRQNAETRSCRKQNRLCRGLNNLFRNGHLAIAVFAAQRRVCFGKPAGMNFSIAASWPWSPRGAACAAARYRELRQRGWKAPGAALPCSRIGYPSSNVALQARNPGRPETVSGRG